MSCKSQNDYFKCHRKREIEYMTVGWEKGGLICEWVHGYNCHLVSGQSCLQTLLRKSHSKLSFLGTFYGINNSFKDYFIVVRSMWDRDLKAHS